MEAEAFLSNYTYLFILIMLRYLGIFLITPIFSSQLIPNRVKIGLSLLLALVTIPLFSEATLIMPEQVILVISGVVRELAIGFILGFVVYLVFAAIQLAGQFIDLRMGFRIANVVDPMSGESSPVVGQFKNVVAMLVFLAINGHHLLIKSLFYSFEIIPPGQAQFPSNLWQFVFRRSADMFILAFKIALQVIGTLFVVDIALGFLARSVPQMNIFIIGLPIKIFLGFIILILSIHIIVNYFDDTFMELMKDIDHLLKLMAPG
ncbi:MAG: flagellar biosynthetic protein FliR [Bacillota bacterium]